MSRDLAGQKFGRLLCRHPFRLYDNSGRARTFWECHCDCGRTADVQRDVLTRGDAVSCGCFQKEGAAQRLTTHGQSRGRLHRIWVGMIKRCTNSRVDGFHNYGGRGISVCAEWRGSFEQFAIDMGVPPSHKHSIDRIDNDGNYEPGNCRWATGEQQGRNRRFLRMVETASGKQCLKAAAEAAGLNYGTVYSRVFKHGWPLAEALSTPPLRGRPPQDE